MEAAFTPCRSGFFNLDQFDRFILVPVSGSEPAAMSSARLLREPQFWLGSNERSDV